MLVSFWKEKGFKRGRGIWKVYLIFVSVKLIENSEIFQTMWSTKFK